MSLVIESPNESYSLENMHNIHLFLAGGITNCPDWQSEIIKELSKIKDLTIYNPRRKDFPMNDPNAAEQQITWEFHKLATSHIIIFWFSKGSLNPIVLYELGMWGNSRDMPLVIGIDPEYERAQDVIIQTRLCNPNTPIVTSLKDVVKKVKKIIDDIEYE